MAKAPVPALTARARHEHDDISLRRGAPVLAIWDGNTLQAPAALPSAGGYFGDIVAGPDGGLVLSCLRANIALQWCPSAPRDLVAVAQSQEVGALAPWVRGRENAGVLLAAARGLGRWHPTLAPALLKWPAGLVPDNHWVGV